MKHRTEKLSLQPKENSPRSWQIAIDGPVAAGKGTVSRALAEALGFLYVDTGAMYRCAAYLANLKNIPLDNETAITGELMNHQIDLARPAEDEMDGRLITVLLDGEDVSWKIRTPEISRLTPTVAQYESVREELVRRQQIIAAAQNVVMEGRDITQRVLPQAQLKIYLTADPEQRAARRHQELIARGVEISFDQVLRDLLERDRVDLEKNLRVVPGAWVLDSTNLTVEQVVAMIVGKVKELQNVADHPHR